MKKYKVFVLDDHKIIRDGIRSNLTNNENFTVSGESGDPVKFVEDLSRIDLDILILDLSFQSVSGFQILQKVKKQRPEVKVLILSMHNNPEYMQKSATLGADGYLTKDCDTGEIITALDSLIAGKKFFAHSAFESLSAGNSSDILSIREKEVLKLLSNGLSSKEIASELSISTRTVETHRLNIMKKLGTSNSAETISVAVKLNLL